MAQNTCGNCGGPSTSWLSHGSCDECKAQEGRAWCIGFDDAKAGTYDCRAHFSFRDFTAYQHGWGMGSKVAR